MAGGSTTAHRFHISAGLITGRIRSRPLSLLFTPRLTTDDRIPGSEEQILYNIIEQIDRNMAPGAWDPAEFTR